MISFFLGTAPGLGWPGTQLEFPSFLRSCLSAGLLGASFLHLGLLLWERGGDGGGLMFQKRSALALSVPGPTFLGLSASPSPLPSFLPFSFSPSFKQGGISAGQGGPFCVQSPGLGAVGGLWPGPRSEDEARALNWFWG